MALHQTASNPPVAPRGFSLIELLVVISIVTVLISMLLPALSKSRDTAREKVCGGNLRQHGFAVHNYAADNRDTLVPRVAMYNLALGYKHNFGVLLAPYMGDDYGQTDWKTRHYSNGPQTRRGTVYACPSELYLEGALTRQYIPFAGAANVMGYPERTYASTSGFSKFSFTSYSINAYTVAADSLVMIQAKMSNLKYPSALWVLGESYPLAWENMMSATALKRSSTYSVVNFERHAGYANMWHADGHVANYHYDLPGAITTFSEAPSEAVVKSYKHWGFSLGQGSTGW